VIAAASPDPIGLFRQLLAQREVAEETPDIPVALATADAAGAPSVRMVLLKAVDTRGFVFFTNYDSRKAREL
jgi:pyridoxamine 5'-phosphate oxidase